MKSHPISLHCLALALLIMSLPRIQTVKAAGFTIDLIHRDSIHSPSQRVKNALQRSFDHANNLFAGPNPVPQNSPSTDIIPDRGEYLMRFSLGTPGVETLAIADTGSDLTWVQCQQCIKCFDQKSPIFYPKKSSSYEPILCSSQHCNSLPRTSCGGPKNEMCSYTIMYGDRSYSKGDMAIETVTLGSSDGESVPIHNVTIGCGHLNQGTFGSGSSGIVGLGGGNTSLITQMRNMIEGKFSYCLVPFLGESRPSKMNFGEKGVVSGGGVVSTPIVTKNPTTFYFLTLEGVTVGKQRLNLVSPSSSSSDDDNGGDVEAFEQGNIIIDSGTTLTFLPIELYNQVVTAVKSQVALKEISDPQGILKLCYMSMGNEISKVPEITVHFRGADLKLNSVNTFVKTSPMSLCLAFAPTTTFSIYGNLAQMNFLVGYDLEKKTVSFKPTVCSNA